MKKISRRNFGSLLFFEIVYRSVIFSGALYFADSLIVLLLRRQNYSYMTAENYLAFISSPLMVVLICVGIGSLSLLLLWESMAVVTEKMCSRWGIRCQMPQLLRWSLKKTWAQLGRFPVSMFLTGLGALPFLTFPLWIVEVFQIRLFQAIAGKLLNSFSLVLVLAVGMGALVLSALCAMLLGRMLILEISPFSAARGLYRVWKEKRAGLLRGLLGTQILCWGVSGVLFLMLCILAAGFIYLTVDSSFMVSAALVYGKRLRKLLGIVAGAVQILTFMQWNIRLHLPERMDRQLCPERKLFVHFSEKLSRIYHLRSVSALTAVALLAVAGWNLFSLSSFSGLHTLAAGELQVTAHRGGAGLAPENTLAALRMAGSSFADYAEIDVQETHDGALVLLHDGSLKRTTGVNRNIWTMTLDEVKKLDAGRRFGKDFSGEPVPTLEEAICCAREENLMLNIEVKFNGHNKDIVTKVVQTIEEQEFEKHCVLTSQNYSFLVRAKKENPNIRTGYILSMAYGDLSGLAAADFFSVKYTYVDEKFVERLHRIGREVHAWTLNYRGFIKQMADCGVDNIITDNPNLVYEVLLGKMDKNPGVLKLIRYLIR